MKHGVKNMENKNPLQVAERLFDILELLVDHGSLGLMEISKALNLNKSTTHRILNSLIYMGYVKQNEESRKYECTFKLVNIASKIMSRIDIVSLVRPYLRELMETTKETVHFVAQDGLDAVYIDKVESFTNNIQMVSRIGNRIPLYCSGVGKAMVAEMSASEALNIWNNSDIKKLTPYTITEYEDFISTLDTVRKQHYALDNEENEIGVKCIAASLQNPIDKTRYAFSISAPISRMDSERIQELSAYVLKTKEKIETEIFPKFE